MHVAASVLRTRIAFVHGRWLGWISVVATALIFVGSIHLGWHYAVDGIAGAAIALAAWWVAGPILALWSRWVPASAA